MNELEKKDVRFHQRFSNFERAYVKFENALTRDTEHDEILRSGLIQTFEYTFELGWKSMKDKLMADGINVSVPREVIKEAFQAGYINDAKVWVQALDSRNEMSHAYDEALSKKVEGDIRSIYAPMIKELLVKFKTLIS